VAVASNLTGSNAVVALTVEVKVIETVEAGGVKVVLRKLLQSLLAIIW
jgi:hypothetical protein